MKGKRDGQIQGYLMCRVHDAIGWLASQDAHPERHSSAAQDSSPALQ